MVISKGFAFLLYRYKFEVEAGKWAPILTAQNTRMNRVLYEPDILASSMQHSALLSIDKQQSVLLN